MISGTNGLLGAADGAFLLQKESAQATQQRLKFRAEISKTKDFISNETKAHSLGIWSEQKRSFGKSRPNRCLNLSLKNNSRFSEWQGTPTELCDFLSVDMKANALTMKLNINAGRLYNEYGIRYENKRCHDGRKVRLYLEQA